jgi:hypothetical protein
MKVTITAGRVTPQVPDGEYTLKKPTKTRSIQENSYMWGVVYTTLANELGYSVEEIHDEMKRRFLPRTGKLEIPVSTTELTTREMEDYLSKIRIFASSELDIFIAHPNEDVTL